MCYVMRVLHNSVVLFIRKDGRKWHRVVANLPRRRLGEFPVDYIEEIEVLVDKNILFPHIHVGEMEWACFESSEN